jgi:hypothetical protein
VKQTYKYITPHHVYNNVWLEKQKYSNGRVALMLMNEEGQVACATVNLPEHDIQADEIIVKTWSENEAMLDFLVRNQIVSDTGREIPTGFVVAKVCKLLMRQ